MVGPLPLALLLLVGTRLVDEGEAARMLADGAVAIDVRPAEAFARGHVAGAVSAPGGIPGLEPDARDERLAEVLGAAEVRPGRPVLVVGALPQDGGAVGWLAWVLAYLGHPHVAVLDGGFAAWRAAGRPVEASAGEAPQARGASRGDGDVSAEEAPQARGASRGDGEVSAEEAPKARGASRGDGDVSAGEAPQARGASRGEAAPARAGSERPFVPRRVEEERARIDEIAASGRNIVLLDVRTTEEWRGATPYGEARGGHIPGARHLPFTQLLDARGRVLAPALARRRLAAAGVPRGARVIVYCTSGARSGFAWLVLRTLGYRARNFDASFRAWAAEPSLPVAPR